MSANCDGSLTEFVVRRIQRCASQVWVIRRSASIEWLLKFRINAMIVRFP